MEDSPKTTSQETPFQDMSFVSPPYGVVRPPFMATFSNPGLTIGFPMWLFSNHVIPNSPFVSDFSPSLHGHQIHVNPSPSSSNVESTYLSSSSPVENSDVSKQVGKKKTKRKSKKKNTKQKAATGPTSDFHVGNSSATNHSAESVELPTKTLHKPKFPCRLCKCDHLLKDCPIISLVL